MSSACTSPDLAELLPWYANGILDGEEHRLLETHIAACPVCRREVEILRSVGRALQEEDLRPLANLYERTRERVRPRGFARFAHAVRQILTPVPVYARVALAAQLAVIAILAVALVPVGPFVTLWATPTPPGPAARIQVVFEDRAPAAEITRVLSELGARIADGPSPAGVYGVEVPLRAGVTAAEALRRLRASPVVAFAEVVQERR
jgi:hypothetical protein